jgi:hypothetical protein
VDKWGNDIVDFCNIGVLNSHFNRYKTIKVSPNRWFGPYLGLIRIIFSLINSRTQRFQYFVTNHHAQPYLKTIYYDAWQKEFEWLDKSCSYKFRQDISLNHWFLRYWQLAGNHFFPNHQRNKLFIGLTDNTSYEYVWRKLLDERMKCICLNDTPMCSDMKYNELKTFLASVFESKFQHKSEFEK